MRIKMRREGSRRVSKSLGRRGAGSSERKEGRGGAGWGGLGDLSSPSGKAKRREERRDEVRSQPATRGWTQSH